MGGGRGAPLAHGAVDQIHYVLAIRLFVDRASARLRRCTHKRVAPANIPCARGAGGPVGALERDETPDYWQVVPGAAKISRVIVFDCVTELAMPATCTV
jgi:hypothetical protein